MKKNRNFELCVLWNISLEPFENNKFLSVNKLKYFKKSHP